MQQGILSGKEIEMATRLGEIDISPFEASQLNPASYDLTLGEGITVYEGFDSSKERLLNCLDPKRDNPATSFKMGPEGYVLRPGVGYLMHTREVVGTNKYVPAIDGKSSIGRLFAETIRPRQIRRQHGSLTRPTNLLENYIGIRLGI